MNKLWVIARKDIREAFRSRSTYIFIAIMIVVTFSYFGGYAMTISNLKNQHASAQVIFDASSTFLNNVAYVLPMMYSIFVCTIFANYSVILDKARRNIESLMATPVSINHIWLGKSLAVTLPSIIIGIGVTIIAYIVMNFGFIIPQTGRFIFPEVMAIVSVFIIVPVLILAIVSIVIYVQLVISNPRVANFVFTAIFLALLFSTIVVGTVGISIGFAVIYGGVIVLCVIIAYFLSRSLTKEKVLLSSKG